MILGRYKGRHLCQLGHVDPIVDPIVQLLPPPLNYQLLCDNV